MISATVSPGMGASASIKTSRRIRSGASSAARRTTIPPLLVPARIKRRAGQCRKAATATAAVNISEDTTTPPTQGEATPIAVATTVGITERTAAQIVNELEQAGYLTKTRDGRRNQYEVHEELPLRHPEHRHRTIGDLIRFIQPPARTPSRRRS